MSNMNNARKKNKILFSKHIHSVERKCLRIVKLKQMYSTIFKKRETTMTRGVFS